MDLPIFFPNLKKGSTKDCIIQLLTKNTGMSNQKIFNSVRKEYGLSKSYQTIRQALSELAQNNVIEKNGKQYSISKAWIYSLENYAKLLRKKFLENKDIRIIDENTREISLTSLYDLGHFILYSFRQHFFDMNRENDLYVFVRHLWIPFTDNNKRAMLKEFFSGNRNFVFVRSSSFGDKLLSHFYKEHCMIKFNVKIDTFFDIIIQGDCIAKIYFPDELRKRMDKSYSLRILRFDLVKEISDLTYDNYPIKILINRDKNMVNEIKGQMKIM